MLQKSRSKLSEVCVDMLPCRFVVFTSGRSSCREMAEVTLNVVINHIFLLHNCTIKKNPIGESWEFQELIVTALLAILPHLLALLVVEEIGREFICHRYLA